MNIDYTNLNERIVKQAYEYAPGVLTKEQVQKLVQNKIDRAAAMITARDTVYHQIED